MLQNKPTLVEFGNKAKIYSKHASLTAEATQTRKDNRATITIDVAPRLNEGADWDNKISIQLTSKELPDFTRVLYGMASHVKFDYHGDSKNKSLEAITIPDGVMISLSKPGLKLSIPAKGGDLYALMALSLERLVDNHAKIGSVGVLASLRALTRPHPSSPIPS